jgi:2-amino-4-hydroxy-6-hydroxymethyldihydropteridine diphosphokinase
LQFGELTRVTRLSTFRAVSEIAYIALGSNLGDRRAYLDRARDAIAAIPECRVVAATQVEETEPLGGLAQPPYLNQMVAVETTLDPRTLLARLHAIEADAGRVRGARWESRTLDLDIVQFDDRVVESSDLVIPHPGLADRPFWQHELAELKDAVARVADE